MQQYNLAYRLTPMVKRLVIANLAIWVVGIMILQRFLLPNNVIFEYFALNPARFGLDFMLWQPVTYMFLHSPSNVFHVVFNMLILFFFGMELEQRWGSKFFLAYYMVCGVGAGLIYTICLWVYALLGGDQGLLLTNVVGASGAVFGLLLAYGMVFGERVVYFMMMFPMKAKYFVMIIGGIELLTVLGSGVHGPVANLAHLGGLVSCFLFLVVYGKMAAKRRAGRSKKGRRGRNLKLVVNNERSEESDSDGPRYWN